jgi:23S rRNA (cytosine1962-C5)-methyltransferase
LRESNPRAVHSSDTQKIASLKDGSQCNGKKFFTATRLIWMSFTLSLRLLEATNWKDYELLDSGDGWKLERFGPFVFARPEAQAIWKPMLPSKEWRNVHARFEPAAEESGGHWTFYQKVPQRWELSYPLPSQEGVNTNERLRFWVMCTSGRHLGLFPEVAPHWDWLYSLLRQAGEKRQSRPRVLNLFGYTGLATLAAAAAGAEVTHVDASRKVVQWGQENAKLSGLEQRPIRWLVDDALKFVMREVRRGRSYDGILLDPPKFGRGPKGEVWEVYESLPDLLDRVRQVLSPHPLFLILNLYAVRASAIHVAQALAEIVGGYSGRLEYGELLTRETHGGRYLSHAVYARWGAV